MKGKIHVLISLVFISITSLLVGWDFIFGNVPTKILFAARWITLLSLVF